METTALKKLYQSLDNLHEFHGDVFMGIDESISDDEKDYIRIEYYVLSGGLIPTQTDNEKQRYIFYLQNRINEQIHNSFLLSKYYNALYVLTNNRKYCIESIKNTYALFNYYISHEGPHYKHNAYQALGYVFRMSRKVKVDQSQIEIDLVSLLKDDSTPDLTKYWILIAIKTDFNCCKYKSLDFAPQLCLDIFLRMDDYTMCKNILEVGEFFANHYKTVNQTVFYEHLGDNENKRIRTIDHSESNIIISHANQQAYLQMMKYYKRAGNNEKLIAATREYNDNKSNLKYITIEESQVVSEKEKKHINGIVKKMGECHIETLIYFLSSDNRYIFPSHKFIEETWGRVEDAHYFHVEHFSAVKNDINGNQQETTYESMYKSQAFQMWITNSFKLILRKILAINFEGRRLTYNKIKHILLQHSTFGMEIFTERGQKEIKYCWFDRVDIAIKDYFTQLHNERIGKPSDWRLVINTLTIQFEGILRDFIRVYSGETTKIKDGKKTIVSEMLLDDLLRTESFAKLFSDEDKDLFTYTFTNEGYNIRNNVAHGFYLPCDYTAFKATLVLLCVLRLVRFDNDIMNIILADLKDKDRPITPTEVKKNSKTT